VAQAKVQPYAIELWTPQHDAAAFSSGMMSIDKYIKNQAHRDMSSHASLVFVLTEPESKVIRAYYALSSVSIVFEDLPEKTHKKLPRYPQMSGTLLGRLGVDRNYSAELHKKLHKKPHLCQVLLMDAQSKTLQGAIRTAGAALMIIDAERPTEEELAAGIRDPLTFYTRYGFTPFPRNERRLFKLTREIEKEFREAGLV
jgi:hypothetical protein